MEWAGLRRGLPFPLSFMPFLARLTRWLSLLPLAGCFAAAGWTMRYDWTYDESYHYGWVVLPLALYLFSLRWRDRPVPGAVAGGWWLGLGGVFLALAYPAVWLVREANPEWRLLSIALALLAVLAALLHLGALGGRAWVRHFLGPVLFFLTAVPWPSVLEKAVAASLMPTNAAIALEALHWINIPAIRSGHLITLPGGTLGVEEACSGIRSLQSTLMMAGFLGELYLLRISARGLLLACGLAFALCTNVLRTVGLSALAAREGLAAAHDWHDAAGYLALGANVLGLFGLTARFCRGAAARPVAGGVGLEARPSSAAVLRGAGLCGAGLLLMFPLTGWWYGRRETASLPPWHLVAPLAEPGYRPVPIDDRTALMLRHTFGWSARWNSRTGQSLQGFYFEWGPGRVPPENMNVHLPGGCLGAIGIDFVEEYAPLEVELAGHRYQARHLRFEREGRPLQLLYLVAEDSMALQPTPGAFDFSYQRRLQSVLQGRRNPGQRLVEIGLWSEPSQAAARVAFAGFLEAWLRDGPRR